MAKRSFLAPLAMSIAALLGTNTAPAQAKTEMNPTVAPVAQQSSNPDFVLQRASSNGLLMADHESHASHASHESHASHASHVSGR